MGKAIAKFIPSIAAFLIGLGLEMSGVEIPQLGFGMIALGVALLAIPGWRYLRAAWRIVMRLRVCWPISFMRDEAVAESPKTQSSQTEMEAAEQGKVDRQQVIKLTPLAKWMSDLVRYDRGNSEDCILIYKTKVNFTHLRDQDQDKYMEFNFHLISSSVFLLDIGVRIDGCIQYSTGKRLKDVPIIEKPIRQLIRGKPTILVVRQYVSDNIANHIRENAGTEMPLGMGQVHISVEGRLPDDSRGTMKDISWH